MFLKTESLREYASFRNKQILFKSWDELGLRRRLIVICVVSFGIWLNSVKNLSLTELYNGQSIKKWCSSSTLSLQALQNLSFAGVIGLQYLPVSTRNRQITAKISSQMYQIIIFYIQHSCLLWKPGRFNELNRIESAL